MPCQIRRPPPSILSQWMVGARGARSSLSSLMILTASAYKGGRHREHPLLCRYCCHRHHHQPRHRLRCHPLLHRHHHHNCCRCHRSHCHCHLHHPHCSGGGEGQIGAIVEIKSGTIRLPVPQSTGGGGKAVPRWRGQWQLPARWLSSICPGDERHVARIIVLRNNQHKRKEVKWQCNGSPGGDSSAIVGMAATTCYLLKNNGTSVVEVGHPLICG
jgi:hypothetical protein